MSDVSIITTSYNQKKTLELLFESLNRQTMQEFEVIVADDGSKDETRALCEEKSRWKFPIRFITQEDQGYRKSKILNRATRVASDDYLIFLDADVLVEKHFVEDHLRMRRPSSFVCGRRVDLGPNITREISVHDIRSGRLDGFWWKLTLSALKKDTLNLKRGFRVVSPRLREILGYTRPIDILGSNMSLWKRDLIAINGFNEALESYWGEDGDLFIRLRNAGKKAINAKNACIQFHTFHERRVPTPENIKMVEKLIENHDYKWAEKGYEKSTS